MDSDPAAIVPRVLVLFFGSVCAVVGLGVVGLTVVAMSQGAGPSLIPWVAVGFVLIFIACVTLTRVAVAATFREQEGEIRLHFGLRQPLTIRRTQLSRARNLALARGGAGVAGDLTKQMSRVYVLLTYNRDNDRRDFAILVLPGLGPFGGRARDFRTRLDSYCERTLTSNS